MSWGRSPATSPTDVPASPVICIKLLKLVRRGWLGCVSWSVARYRDKPMPDEIRLAELSIAAARNARRQHREAAELVVLGRWPTAYVVAALGLEEVGKAHLCATALHMSPEMREQDLEGFWEIFYSHTKKAAFARLPLSMVASAAVGNMEALWNELTAAASRVHDTKMRGLYVDVDVDGALLEPPTVITEDEARAMVDELGNVLDSLLAAQISLEDIEDPAEFAAFQRWLRERTDLFATFASCESEEDAARMMNDIGAMVRGETPAPWLREALPELLGDGPQPPIVLPTLDRAPRP